MRRSAVPQRLNNHAIGVANDARAQADPRVRMARMAARRSPYAAGKAKADDSDGDTTPGIKKLSPINRKVWGTVNAISACSRRAVRSRGQMYIWATMPKATKLMVTLRPNNGRLFMRVLPSA
jgi:hypothetical protein